MRVNQNKVFHLMQDFKSICGLFSSTVISNKPELQDFIMIEDCVKGFGLSAHENRMELHIDTVVVHAVTNYISPCESLLRDV